MVSRRALLTALCQFSYAGLLLAPAWIEVVPGTLVAYQFGVPLEWSVLGALWLTLLVVTGFVCAAHALARRLKVVRVGCFVAALVLAYVLVEPTRWLIAELNPSFDVKVLVARFGKGAVVALAASLAFAALWLALAHNQLVARLGRASLIIASPLPVLFSLHIARALTEPTPDAARALASSAPHRARIVLLIFDEWDREFAFERRPLHLDLPEVDRLRAESTEFAHALPPSIMTLRSVPSILSGELWEHARLRADGQMEFRAHGEPRALTHAERPDVFTFASRAGLRSHYIQWGLVPSHGYVAARPGLRVDHFDGNRRYADARYGYTRGVGSAMLHHGAALHTALRAPLGVIWPQNYVTHHLQIARAAEATLLSAIDDDDAGLIVAHLPYPHPPAVFDARRNAFVDRAQTSASTLDNMVLVDRTLGSVRARLEAKGRWAETLVIATSDHWQRAATAPEITGHQEKLATERGYRVPLLVKFPGQREGATIQGRTLNTIVFDLVTRRLLGHADSPDTCQKLLHTPPDDMLLRYDRPNGWHP